MIVTNHAARRYADRVKPMLSVDEAKREILRLAEGQEVTDYLDYHVEPENGWDRDPGYIELAPGIALAGHRENRGFVGVTVLIRGGHNSSPEAIAQRRAYKRYRKRKRQAQKARETIARRRGESRGDEDAT